MKKLFIAIGILAAASSAHAADVGVSISVGQPGFYGRIDIGNAPQPQLIYAAPIVIHAPPPQVVYQPMYLRVPPGHEKKWSKHCSKYNACGHPVYFVRDNWYNNVYAPHYQKEHKDDDRGNKGKGHGKEKKDKGNRDN